LIVLSLKSINCGTCTSSTDCVEYSDGGCCLKEVEYYGVDGYFSSQVCRSAMEISYYTNSLGWDESTSIWTNPANTDEYMLIECIGGGSIGENDDDT